MLGCYMFVLWLRMALVDIAERLRHEMELIIKTELVLGPTTMSHFLACVWWDNLPFFFFLVS